LIRADNTLTPLILMAGHNPSQEQKCLTLPKRLKSVPISLYIFITESRPKPSGRSRWAREEGGGYSSEPFERMLLSLRSAMQQL